MSSTYREQKEPLTKHNILEHIVECGKELRRLKKLDDERKRSPSYNPYLLLPDTFIKALKGEGEEI